MYKKFIQILGRISKRQKFIISVIVLSTLLFFSENLLGKSGLSTVLILSVLTNLFLLWALHGDLKSTQIPQVLILPFFYSLSFGLFYFLVPARFLTRVIITSLYGFGLYSLFLSINIFIISSIRTIALLSSARTVSFVVTLLSYFFLTNVLFSFHLNIFLTLLILSAVSFPIILYSIWTHALDEHFFSQWLWAASLTICLVEVSLILWFWPITPTIIALFLTGFFYIIVGLSQVWLAKRLFRNVMWEYIWVAVIIFILFLYFSFRS